MYKLVLLYAIAFSSRMGKPTRYIKNTSLAFGSDTFELKEGSILSQWWAKRQDGVLCSSASSSAVTAYLGDACPIILSIRTLVETFLRDQEALKLPASKFIGAALKIERGRAKKALDFAELAIASRILSLDPSQVTLKLQDGNH